MLCAAILHLDLGWGRFLSVSCALGLLPGVEVLRPCPHAGARRLRGRGGAGRQRRRWLHAACTQGWVQRQHGLRGDPPLLGWQPVDGPVEARWGLDPLSSGSLGAGLHSHSQPQKVDSWYDIADPFLIASHLFLPGETLKAFQLCVGEWGKLRAGAHLVARHPEPRPLEARWWGDREFCIAHNRL